MSSALELKIAKSIGKQLREARESQKGALSGLARSLGCSVSELMALECGNPFAFSGSMERLLDRARCYADELKLTLRDDPLPPPERQKALTVPIPDFLRKTPEA